MNDDYFDALRRTGKAWEAYIDAASRQPDETESPRCAALWTQFEESVGRLKAMRTGRPRS